MASTTLFGTAQAGGGFVVCDVFACPGTPRFVDSATGTDGPGYGRTSDAPFATLGYAAGLCDDGKGDVIFVMAGHAETLATAGAVTLARRNVRVVGEGVGRNRPVFTFAGSTAASLDITASGCVLEGLVFINAADGQTAMVNVRAPGCVIRDCEFDAANASTQAAVAVLANDEADGLLVEGNHVHGTPDAGTTSAISFGACDRVVIRRNLVYGAHGTTGTVSNSAAASNVVIERNTLVNQSADGNNKTVVLHASTRGHIANNRSGIIDSTSPAPFTAAAGYVGGNTSASAAGVAAAVLI